MGMPMADLFAPDINIVPARAVYPTASGGTSASAGGAMTANTNVVAANGDTDVATVPGNPSGAGLGYWLGFLGLLVLLVLVARKVGGPEDFRNMRPTFYNFMMITLTSIVGIVGLKVIFAKWRIPGASDVIMAV